MAEDKKSFIAYADWNETFKKLTDEEAGRLSKMLFSYVCDENPAAPDRITELLFEPIKQSLKRDLKKYETIRKKRSEAGKAGGLKSGETRSNSNQNEANEANASKTQANEAVSVSVSVSDSVSGIVNENNKRVSNSAFAPPAILEVVSFFKEKGYTEEAARKAFDYYDAAEWKDSTGKKVKNWKQKMIAVWMKPENKIPEKKITTLSGQVIDPSIFEKQY